MREIDFLPDGYRRCLRQRRRLVAQSCIAMTLLALLGLRVAAARYRTSAAIAETTRVRTQIDQSTARLPEVDRLTRVREQWSRQEQRIARLGPHVDAARLLAALDDAMPTGVSLVDLQVDTEERPSTTAPSDATRQRRLRVRLEGVAATPAEMQKFVTRLTAVPFFEQVTVGFSRDAVENGRSLRQFELTFSLDLNHPM